MISNISILGSTGSIGTQALEVVKNLNLKVSALAANKNIDLLEKQVREFKPEIVGVYDKTAAQILKNRISDLNTKVVESMEGLCECATIKNADMVLNSVVGMIGLKPTLEAINAKKDIALANKETLVVGGELVIKAAKENNIKILPVDSEHSAIFQCLQGCNDKKELNRLILTASGGPFFGKTLEDLNKVTPSQALKHPNWSMGAKITIDSATMMNKGLEIIEAAWLFDMNVDNIDVVVHRESIIHSLIEYKDYSVIAQLGLPDMKIPIQYAITYPERYKAYVKQLNLTDIKNLSFYKPDYDTFKCLNICKEAMKCGGTVPTIINGANEEAVKLFLDEKIKFTDISCLVKEAMDNQEHKKINNLNDIMSADIAAREYVLKTAL